MVTNTTLASQGLGVGRWDQRPEFRFLLSLQWNNRIYLRDKQKLRIYRVQMLQPRFIAKASLMSWLCLVGEIWKQLFFQAWFPYCPAWAQGLVLEDFLCQGAPSTLSLSPTVQPSHPNPHTHPWPWRGRWWRQNSFWWRSNWGRRVGAGLSGAPQPAMACASLLIPRPCFPSPCCAQASVWSQGWDGVVYPRGPPPRCWPCKAAQQECRVLT